MLRGAHSSPLSHGTDSLNGMNQTIGNTTLRHQNVALLGIAEAVAPVEVTSKQLDAELADVLTRLGLPHGLLERVAGVHTRRQWETQDGFIAGSAPRSSPRRSPRPSSRPASARTRSAS